jgi:isoleucyl-tRNA synthetase
MDANDRMILLSNSEIKEDIEIQSTILNSIKESINNVPNIINYILLETIAAFIVEQRNESNSLMKKFEINLTQGINAINWEIQNQGKEFRENFNKFEDVEEIGG